MTTASEITKSLQNWNSRAHQAKLRAMAAQTKFEINGQKVKIKSDSSLKLVEKADEIHEKTQSAYRKAQHAILEVIRLLRS